MVEKTKWLDWNGEARFPVLPKTIVDVEFRDGSVVSGRRADYWSWSWDDIDFDGDIICYRVWQESEEE